MRNNLKCRQELGKFRWDHVSLTQKIIAMFSFLALFVMLCIPYPEENDAILVSVLITAFFFIFLLLFTMAIIYKRIAKVNREYKDDLNAIRKQYGIEGK